MDRRLKKILIGAAIITIPGAGILFGLNMIQRAVTERRHIKRDILRELWKKFNSRGADHEVKPD